MTKISDLPISLVEEILCRVSVKNMREVRSTCKEWDTLSKSRSFSKMHIDKISAAREGESVMIAAREDDATKAIVWNPYWGQTRSIEFRFSHSGIGWDGFNYALGYEDKGSGRSYKFLRFIDQYVDYYTRDRFVWYEIYDFDSSSWKTLDITPNWRIICHQEQGGVSLKGNTYWPAFQSYPKNYSIDHIICFDFTSESFGPLLHLPFSAGEDDYVTLSCVREEKLAALLTHNEAGPLEFDIWITTKIEAEKVLWSKFLRVETETGFFALVNSRGYFIDEGKKVAMGFAEYYTRTFNIVGEAGYLKKLELVEGLAGNIVYGRAMAYSYVQSLVQIKQPAAGGKRKEQSDLEKQLFDQKMSGLAAAKKRIECNLKKLLQKVKGNAKVT